MRVEKSCPIFKLKTQLYTLHENRFLVKSGIYWKRPGENDKCTFFCILYLTRVLTQFKMLNIFILQQKKN